MSSPSRTPPLRLQAYPRERLLLVLIALAALTNLYPLNTQDVTRLSLSFSVVHRQTLNVDPYHDQMLDRSHRAGHWYSDKAPGISFIAIPTVEAFHLLDSVRGGPAVPIWKRPAQLWAVRLLTAGIGLMLATFLVGRVAEGLARGTGAASAATFALATIAGPLGPTVLEHDLSAALAFAAFVLAWRRPDRLFVAGLVAGASVLVEYQAAIVCVVLFVYVLATRGRRAAAELVGGALPGAFLLGLYNALAFGSPLHFSYDYVANRYTALQEKGFFGIGVPTGHGIWLALFDGRGLLVVSPVVLAAAAGLVALFRRGRRAEALVCGAVVLLFLLLDTGYFDPYGGAAPGPRFLVVSLPFLAVGLPEAYRRWPVPTAVLAAVSVALVTWDSFAWLGLHHFHLPTTPETIWSRAGAPRLAGVLLVALAAAAASLVAGRELVERRRPAET